MRQPLLRHLLLLRLLLRHPLPRQNLLPWRHLRRSPRPHLLLVQCPLRRQRLFQARSAIRVRLEMAASLLRWPVLVRPIRAMNSQPGLVLRRNAVTCASIGRPGAGP